MRPPTLPDLHGSPLLTEYGKGPDFSITDCGAHNDCWECQFFELGEDAEGGEFCAFEAAALIGNASPELLRLFGWTESETQAGWFDAPDRCPWFADKTAPPVPFYDPRQITLPLSGVVAPPSEPANDC